MVILKTVQLYTLDYFIVSDIIGILCAVTCLILYNYLSLADCGERDSSNKNTTYQYHEVEGSTIRNQCSGNAMSTLYPTYSVNQKRASKYICDIGSITQYDFSSCSSFSLITLIA